VEISVREAAQRLGVDESRVRQLLRGGDLVGRRVGKSWLVRGEDLAPLEARRRLHGRPMGPARGWGALDLLTHGSAPWLSPAARSQVRSALRLLVDADANRWRSALHGRSRVLRCRAHPAAVTRLLGNDRVLAAGAVEAARRGVDLVATEEITQVYVPEEQWPSLASSLFIREEPVETNLVVRLPRGLWPFGDATEASVAALAADLLESAEPRAISGGVAKLHELTRLLTGGQG